MPPLMASHHPDRWPAPSMHRSPAAALPPHSQSRTVAIGRELFERMGRGPKPWQRRLVGSPVHGRHAG